MVQSGQNRRRLDAICFTEHRLFPADPELDMRYAELTERFGVMVFKGIEADTNLGHLLLYGVTREVLRRFDLGSRMLKSDQLIEVVHGEGASVRSSTICWRAMARRSA